MSETTTTPVAPAAPVMAADPNAGMHNTIPAAVRRQAAAAEEMAKQATIEAATAQGQTFSTTVGGADLAPATQAPAQAPAKTADWEQRYHSLKGKYDSELPSARATVRQQQEQINALHGTIANLNMAAATPAPAQARSSEADAADVENYGQEFIDKTRAWARADMAPELHAMRAEIQQLRGQTQSSLEQNTQAAVQNALDSAVPDWRIQNNDQQFVAWLGQTEPFSGQVRKDMLTEAYVRGDAARTIAFFTAYNTEQTATGSTGSPAHTSEPYQANGAGVMPLANLAAPGRGRPASPGAPTDKRIWTQRDIAMFFSDVTKGRYRSDPTRRAQIEADIFAAPSEGRLR